jgi:type II secretory pathway pseudopilin PulG
MVTDGGESLLELMIAMAIMGIAVVAIVSGIATSILMSDIHRKQATAGAYVRNYGEKVEAWVAAGNFNTTASPSYPAGTVGFTPPSGGYVASVSSVTCWNDATTAFGSCPTTASVQRVALTVASSDARAAEGLVVIVRQP